MPGVVLFFIAVVSVIVESVLLSTFSVQVWALQTPLVVTIILALDRPFVTGGLILTALFLPVEWLIGGLPGVYSLGLAVVFLAMHAVRSGMQPTWGVARGMAAGLAALLHGMAVLGVLFLLGEGGTRLSSAVNWQMWWSAPIVGIAAVMVGKTFARIDEMMDPRSGDAGLEHGP